MATIFLLIGAIYTANCYFTKVRVVKRKIEFKSIFNISGKRKILHLKEIKSGHIIIRGESQAENDKFYKSYLSLLFPTLSI